MTTETTARQRVRWERCHIGRLSFTAHMPNGEEWTFSRPGGGYVYCDFGKAQWTGTLGKQICYGGGLLGNTVLEEDDAAFEREVKRWLRDYRKRDWQ